MAQNFKRMTYNGVTFEASPKRSSDRDDKKYMRTIRHQGDERIVHWGDPNMEVRADNPQARENFVSRHGCDSKKDPFAPGFHACMDWETDMEHENFLFFELAESVLTAGKPFPGFAPGEFVDMLGREVEYKADELPEYLSGTLKSIQDYQAKGMPGLPIDEKKHEKGDAAGWIVGAELGEVTDSDGNTIPVLTFLVNWTKLGVQKIKEKLQANFSPTVDNVKKSVVGGSLTNWAASVDRHGVPLFTAVELAQGIHYLQQQEMPAPTQDDPPTWAQRFIESLRELVNGKQSQDVNQQAPPETIGDKNMTIELTQEQFDEAVNTRVKAALAELEQQRQKQDGGQVVGLSQLVDAFGLNTEGAQTSEINHLDQLAELVQQQANIKWQAKLAQMQRENRYAELSQRVTGGTPEAPRGFQVDPEVLKAELMKLEPEQAKFWTGLLETTVKSGLHDFGELGHGKKQHQVLQLPDYYVQQLRSGDLELADLRNPIIAPDLGDLSRYDLAEFEEK